MTAREYAKSVNVEVVGKLRRVSKDSLKVKPIGLERFYMDEADNEYWFCYHPFKGPRTWVICTAEGCVI